MSLNIMPITQDLVQYKALFENAPVSILIIDKNGTLVWANSLAKRLMGHLVKEDEMILKSWDWPCFAGYVNEGKLFYYLLRDQGFLFTPQNISYTEGDEKILLWVMPAVSMEVDWVNMQRDIIIQRKMANLGKMIVEMTHELNNPLSSISMATQLLEMTLKHLKKLITRDNDENNESKVQLIEKMEIAINKLNQSVTKAASLREEVLAYSKPNLINPRPYRIGTLLSTYVSEFKNQPIFKNIDIQADLLPKSPSILCDAGKLEQIFYNLMKNAYDATEGHGIIWIRETIEDEEVCIEFEDNGPGVPTEMINKIFSPFLTTKPRNGTGLGLSISEQIIQKHGGSFSVYNKHNSGACFRITFPILKETGSL